VIALAVWMFWIARRHVAAAIRIAVSRTRAEAVDEGEPMRYRWAMVGLVLSFAWMAVFCWLSGCRVVFAVILIALIVSFYIMWARLRAETGLGFLAFPYEVFAVAITPLGSALLLPREIVTVFSTRWTAESGEGLSFDTTTGNLIDVFKIADSAGINTRRLMRAVLGASCWPSSSGRSSCLPALTTTDTSARRPGRPRSIRLFRLAGTPRRYSRMSRIRRRPISARSWR